MLPSAITPFFQKNNSAKTPKAPKTESLLTAEPFQNVTILLVFSLTNMTNQQRLASILIRVKFWSSPQKIIIFRYKSKLILNLIINSYSQSKCKIEEHLSLDQGNILRLPQIPSQPSTFATNHQHPSQLWNKRSKGRPRQRLQQVRQMRRCPQINIISRRRLRKWHRSLTFWSMRTNTRKILDFKTMRMIN